MLILRYIYMLQVRYVYVTGKLYKCYRLGTYMLQVRYIYVTDKMDVCYR